MVSSPLGIVLLSWGLWLLSVVVSILVIFFPWLLAKHGLNSPLRFRIPFRKTYRLRVAPLSLLHVGCWDISKASFPSSPFPFFFCPSSFLLFFGIFIFLLFLSSLCFLLRSPSRFCPNPFVSTLRKKRRRKQLEKRSLHLSSFACPTT